MKRRIVVFIILIASLLPESSFARGGYHSGGHSSGSFSILPVATVAHPVVPPKYSPKYFYLHSLCNQKS